MTATKEYKNLIAFHPGYYVSEVIEDMEMTQEEFAKRLDVSATSISELVGGRRNLSKEMALKLSNLLGTSVEVWLNLQDRYETEVLKIEEEKRLDEECKILNMIDYGYFEEYLGLPKHARDKKSKLKEIYKALKIASLEVLKNKDLLTSYRNTSGTFDEKKVINSNIMLALALSKAKENTFCSFNKKELEKFVLEIRKMTVKQPEEFYPQLVEGLGRCGVVLVILPHLKNSGINGAVKKINNQVMLMINDKNKNADIFWFSLFHELGHIINEDFEISLDYNMKGEFEERADSFARENLIPNDLYVELCSNPITEENIKEIAIKANIHPGIVVGRLQNDGLIKYSEYNNLKINYKVCLSKKESS